MPPSDPLLQEPDDFSLVLGGPLYQLLRQVHLTEDSLGLLRRRVLVITTLAWLPLLVLVALGGELWGGAATVPFLQDAEVHIRYLLAVPLLVIAELVVHERMRPVVKQFLARHLIPAEAMGEFRAAVDSALRLRNSIVAEVVLIALVYGVLVPVVWPHYVALQTSTWYAVKTGSGVHLTPAGMWYAYVSVPASQFLLLRWYFRIFIWTRFLWRVSRIRLDLMPMHPDRVGGLGFLANSAYGFVPLAVAHGAALAGLLANRIFHMGAKLPDFKGEVALMVLFVQGLVFGPLLLFAVQLGRARRTGLREYGDLATRYAREFDAKWLRGGAAAAEPLLGSADIQSLADLANSLGVVQAMRVAPVTRSAVIQLAVATFLPVSPLFLTMMPLEDLVRKLLGALF